MDNSDDIQMCTIPADISYPYQTLFYYLRSKFKEDCLDMIMSPWLRFSRQEYQAGGGQPLWLGIPGDHSVFYNQSVRRKKGLENDELVNDEWKYLPQCELAEYTNVYWKETLEKHKKILRVGGKRLKREGGQDVKLI